MGAPDNPPFMEVFNKEMEVSIWEIALPRSPFRIAV